MTMNRFNMVLETGDGGVDAASGELINDALSQLLGILAFYVNQLEVSGTHGADALRLV